MAAARQEGTGCCRSRAAYGEAADRLLQFVEAEIVPRCQRMVARAAGQHNLGQGHRRRLATAARERRARRR